MVTLYPLQVNKLAAIMNSGERLMGPTKISQGMVGGIFVTHDNGTQYGIRTDGSIIGVDPSE